MGARVATTVWAVSPALVLALDERLGPPVDSYVNGSQTWLTDVPGTDLTLEWRLHPVGGYTAPRGLSHYDVWEAVVAALSAGEDPGALRLGEEIRPLDRLWDGLECYAPFGDDVEPQTLASAATDLLGVAPDAAGLVDHDRVADEWERSRGAASIIALLRAQLSA